MKQTFNKILTKKKTRMSYRDYSFIGLIAVVFVVSILSWHYPLSLADEVNVTTTVNPNGGTSNPDTPPAPVISRVVAQPEKRYVSEGLNYDTRFYFSIHDPVTHELIYKTPTLISSNSNGEYVGTIELPGITEGTYDVLLKSDAHLTRRLENVNLIAGDNAITFSDTAGNGEPLLAGDLNNNGSSPDSLGDDVVNAVDLSILLNQLNQTGDSLRANLNKDGVVDQNDLMILINNLDKVGDSF